MSELTEDLIGPTKHLKEIEDTRAFCVKMGVVIVILSAILFLAIIVSNGHEHRREQAIEKSSRR